MKARRSRFVLLFYRCSSFFYECISHEVIGASRIEPFVIELGSSVQKLSSMSLLKSVDVQWIQEVTGLCKGGCG